MPRVKSQWLLPGAIGALLAGLSPAQILVVTQQAATWTQALPAISPPPRDQLAMAQDSAFQQAVLFGGCCDNSGNAFGDTWTWDGANWTQKSPAGNPPPRWGHAMAYDAAHGQVVLFGGINFPDVFGDTWVWDGTNWTQKTPANSPPPRFYHGMAYDATHGQVVLFGGLATTEGGTLGDTWIWDGTNWTQMAPARSPEKRYALVMAGDARGQVVLFGGAGQFTPSFFGDTWVWDGGNWSHKALLRNPPARTFSGMASGAVQGEVVLFGGDGKSGRLGDTWVWNGFSWAQQTPVVSPPPRDNPTMVSGTANGQVVLFGGQGLQANLLADTWLWLP
jgi:hypothetical protein